MELVRLLNQKIHKNRRPTLAQYQRELLIKEGREQFQKLLDRGLRVPVGLL